MGENRTFCARDEADAQHMQQTPDVIRYSIQLAHSRGRRKWTRHVCVGTSSPLSPIYLFENYKVTMKKCSGHHWHTKFDGAVSFFTLSSKWMAALPLCGEASANNMRRSRSERDPDFDWWTQYLNSNLKILFPNL